MTDLDEIERRAKAATPGKLIALMKHAMMEQCEWPIGAFEEWVGSAGEYNFWQDCAATALDVVFASAPADQPTLFHLVAMARESEALKRQVAALRDALMYLRPGLAVLRNMTRTAGLTQGTARAEEIIEDVKRVLADTAPAGERG